VSKSAFLPFTGDFLTSAVGGLGACFLNEDDNRLRPPFFLTEASLASFAYCSASYFCCFSFSCYLTKVSLLTLAWITALVNALLILSFFGLSPSLDIPPSEVANRVCDKDIYC
jgi:hypothetical protein